MAAGIAVLCIVAAIPFWSLAWGVALALTIVGVALVAWALERGLGLRARLREFAEDWRQGRAFHNESDEVPPPDLGLLKRRIAEAGGRPLVDAFARRHPHADGPLRHAPETYIQELETLSRALEARDVAADLEALHAIVVGLDHELDYAAYRARMLRAAPRSTTEAVAWHVKNEGSEWAHHTEFLERFLREKGVAFEPKQLQARLRAEVDDQGLRRAN